MYKELGIMHIKIILRMSFLLILTSCFLILTSDIDAATMTNKNYKVELGSFNTLAGTTQGQNYKLDTSVGQDFTDTLQNDQYKIISGFQLGSSGRNLFTLSLTPIFVTYGRFSPTTPVTRTSALTITNQASQSYAVLAYQDHSLQKTDGKTIIPDVSCDNGRCNEIQTATWENTLTYGFGYRCDNTKDADCNRNFTDKTFFARFPTLDAAYPAVVMEGARGKDKKTQITYKVNVSGTQAQGPYANTVTFIAVPSL